MFSNLSEFAPYALLTGVLGWFGKAVLEWYRGRANKYSVDRDTDFKIESHRDALTFQILEQAREELSLMRVEVARLRPLEAHLVHFEQALNHLENLLNAKGDTRAAAEAAALDFLERMKKNNG